MTELTAKGIKFSSIRKACEYFKVPIGTISWRIRNKHLSLEEAIFMKTRSNRDRGAVKLCDVGKTGMDYFLYSFPVMRLV